MRSRSAQMKVRGRRSPIAFISWHRALPARHLRASWRKRREHSGCSAPMSRSASTISQRKNLSANEFHPERHYENSNTPKLLKTVNQASQEAGDELRSQRCLPIVPPWGPTHLGWCSKRVLTSSTTLGMGSDPGESSLRLRILYDGF